MAELRTRISTVRIAFALLLVGGVTGALAAAFMAGSEVGAYRERSRAWTRDIRAGGWRPAATRFAVLTEVERFGVTDQQVGNALPLYWPDGVNDQAGSCPRFRPVLFADPMWETDTRWHEAARCDRVEVLAQAAHLKDLDLTEWLSDLDPAHAPGSNTWFGVHRGPWEDLGAVLARSHERILEGDLAGAEADARVVVSAGLHFMRGSPDIGGTAFGSMLIGRGLDHLREIAERRGNANEVSLIMEMESRLAGLRSAIYKFQDVAVKAASIPEQMHWVVQTAQDETIPLGIRAYAATIVGYGMAGNPVEALFGPSDARLEAIQALESQPVLTVASARAREPFELPIRERYKLLTNLTY